MTSQHRWSDGNGAEMKEGKVEMRETYHHYLSCLRLRLDAVPGDGDGDGGDDVDAYLHKLCTIHS